MRDPKEQYTFTNTKDHVQYPAGRAVLPGESITLTVGECPEHAPGAKKAEKGEKQPEDPLAKLLKGKTDDIKAALPALSDESLSKLGELEQSAKDPRKGVLGAIADQQMTRAEYSGRSADERNAELAVVLQQPLKKIVAHLPTIFTAVLKDLATLEGQAKEPRSDLIDAINKIVAARAG